MPQLQADAKILAPAGGELTEIGRYTLLLAESIRMTDDLARGHSDEFLQLPEMAFVAGVIGTVKTGQEPSVADLAKLCTLFGRAANSAHVALCAYGWGTNIPRRRSPIDRVSALDAQAHKGVLSAPGVAAGTLTPAASAQHPGGVQRQPRPVGTNEVPPPSAKAAPRPETQASEASDVIKVRHRARPVIREH